MPSPKNTLIVSVAGSGKTTYLINESLKVKEGRVLITTYTEANELEIRKKFMEINRSIPDNVTIQTWFSFLIKHGVKPFQGSVFSEDIRGMVLVNEASGIWFTNKKGVKIPYTEEKELKKHYFTANNKLFSDKLAKFVVRCDQKSNGAVIDRLSRIYSHIFVDEVQDLSGNDLEILMLFFKSKIVIRLVGDPRQVTYLTHNEKLHSKYKDGNIREFVLEKCKNGLCTVDDQSLGFSHRNPAEICSFSSSLYPELPESLPCKCPGCRSKSDPHTGIFLVKSSDLEKYKSRYQPVILRHQLAEEPEYNFGKSKGLGFDHVLIYPTGPLLKYLVDGKLTKIEKGKIKPAFDIAKFYVALTRARFSAAIVCDYLPSIQYIKGVIPWE